MVKNGEKWSKSQKWSKMVKNGQKWSKMVKMVKNGQKMVKKYMVHPQLIWTNRRTRHECTKLGDQIILVKNSDRESS